MTLPLKNLLGASFSDLYPNRPVWALVSTGATASLNSPVYTTYGEQSNYVPLNVEFPGSAKSRARNFQDEMANMNATFCGYSTQPTTQTYTPTQGMMGIASISTQTGCLANFEAFDNGNYGWYHSQNALAFDLACDSGTIVGEANWRQTFDLVLKNNGRIYKDEIGGVNATIIGGNRPYIDLEAGAISGNFTKVGTGSNWGRGQISHNRNTGHLLIVQPVSGTTGTKLTFRLHLFDLQNKIGRSTTIAQLKSWLQAAALDAARYRYVDVDMVSPNVYYSAANTHDCADTQFVLCDNDEIWAFKSSDVGTIANNTYGNALFSLNLSNGNWLTGTYQATQRITYANTTQYGLVNNVLYGARHMNSDDNSVIAMYQHCYYYIGGYNLAMVSTKSAGASDYNYSTNTSTNQQYSIAPSGGPNFVMAQCGPNSDSVGPTIGFINNETLAATNITPSFVGYMWPGYNRSTCYGVGDIVVKVQPTTEWK